MAMAAMFQRVSKLQNRNLLCNISRSFASASQPTIHPFQVMSVCTPESASGFGEMVVGNMRKYYMLGGKGGVGKTSCAASLAVKFANSGHATLLVSTDPAHSLSDSFAQDFSGGSQIPVAGVDSPLFVIELNPEIARKEFRNQNKGGRGLKDIMNSMGLGKLSDEIGDLKLEDLWDTLPPGSDEMIAIAKVMQLVNSQEYNMFTRIVFDTAPTGHTLRLLSLPDFMDASIGKIMKFKKALSALKSVFSKHDKQQDVSDELEQLRERMSKVRDLFRDPDTTEFIIVTVPTMMALHETSRLHASLRKESVPVKRLIVNQVLSPSTSNCKFCEMRVKDQTRALDMIQNDPGLSTLRVVKAPLVDVEIRGVPALKYMGDLIWR